LSRVQALQKAQSPVHQAMIGTAVSCQNLLKGGKNCDIMLVILDMHRKAPSRPILDTRTRAPLRLAGLDGKAMATSPSERFRSARTMRQALGEVSEEERINMKGATRSSCGIDRMIMNGTLCGSHTTRACQTSAGIRGQIFSSWLAVETFTRRRSVWFRRD
jgi:hypothetical protein